MTHLHLHAEIPGKAIVLIAGCDKELSESLSTEILKLGHRAFRWDPEAPAHETLSREDWHVCLCGPALSESDRLAIERVSCQFTRVIQIGDAEANEHNGSLRECVPGTLSPREWKYLLLSAIEGALATEQLLEWKRRVEKTLFRSLVNQSEPMQTLCRELFSLSESDAPLVFRRESGVDADEIAWCVHDSSRRSRASFLTIDCAGFSSEAFESELFDEISASGSPGLLESLDGGTLHLKNVHTLSQLTQKKLIRFIESPALSRGNSFSLRYINLRWIVSCDSGNDRSNSDPLVQYLQARSDVRTFDLPVLRNRREDIPELSRKILDEASIRLGILPPPLTEDAWKLLAGFDWPGNETQLKRVLSQAIELSDGSALSAEAFSVWLNLDVDQESPGNGLSLADMERQLIESTFARFGGNRERTAQSLGIGLRTLSGKLRQYGYPPRGGPRSNKARSRISHDSSSKRAA